ncbi:MAG TPA: hypothetical protein K8V05_00285 [Butyricimonas virosa]|uniref:Uncharacterized protein n=1 Tax=Butyricimonas virosa TaxID=544645 RepID=A0A921H1S4_9BACT|nr:hypothetical protein [Butyricimonas virosa]
MKQIILSLALLFTMNSLFSQDIFKVGIVKGKHVTYEVKEQNIFPWGRIVKNAHNPDTSKAKLIYPFNLAAQIFDIEMQIAEIIHDHLLPEELSKIRKIAKSFPTNAFCAMLRIDRNKLVQVECFLFDGDYWDGIRKREDSEIPDTMIIPTTYYRY